MEMRIMKKIIISMMAGAMLIFCGNFAQAREESEDGKPAAAKRTRSTAELERGGRKNRDMMMSRRLEAIQKQMERKKNAHNAFIAQLKAIKKQAEKEGAKKTVAMLASLLAKEEKNTTETVKRLEKDKEKVAGQMGKRKQQGKVQPVEVKKAEEPKPAEVEKKKKKKWWKFGRD